MPICIRAHTAHINRQVLRTGIWRCRCFLSAARHIARYGRLCIRYYLALFIGATPTSCPNRASTWFTLSRRNVGLPCSSSRTNRSPTPDFSAKSVWVRLNILRRSLTNVDMELLIYVCVVIPFRVQI